MKTIIMYFISYLQKICGFNEFGISSLIKWPYKIWNKEFISIGKNTFIAENCFLAVSKVDKVKPQLNIGNNCCIGSNFFAACIDEITIENKVLISDRVFISDHIHNYKNIDKPIIDQELVPRGKVLIKEGAFIGINTVIMPGVTIGKNAVVGASSVVIKDVGDYTVVTGNPAKEIIFFNIKNNLWEKKL